MAVPHLLLALILVSTLGKGSLNAAFAIAISVVPSMARVTRSVALAVRQQEYVRAAIARGVESISMIARDNAPNPWLAEHYPGLYMVMGETAEVVARGRQIESSAGPLHS